MPVERLYTTNGTPKRVVRQKPEPRPKITKQAIEEFQNLVLDELNPKVPYNATKEESLNILLKELIEMGPKGETSKQRAKRIVKFFKEKSELLTEELAKIMPKFK